LALEQSYSQAPVAAVRYLRWCQQNEKEKKMAITTQKTLKLNNRLHTLGVWMVAALLVQILVGMANNLWLTIPANPNAWSQYTPMLLLNAHLWVGTALTVLGIWIPIDAFRCKNRTWLVSSVIGFVLIMGAFGGGSVFISSAGENDSASMAMAVTCVLALACFLVPFLKRKKA
jgi:hypothetical protein